MNFNLVADSPKVDIADSINYLLANLNSTGAVYNPSTGQITSGNTVIGYIYQYLAVKYATSYNGGTGFSDSPTNATYYGLANSSSSTESLNPNNYAWTAQTFGTTNFLWYLTTGGRKISIAISPTSPGTGWVQDSGGSINLDQVASIAGTNGLQGAQGVSGYFTQDVDLDVLSEAISLSGQNANPFFNSVVSTQYANTGTVVNSTGGLTTISCTTQNTYLTGTTGASLAITLPSAAPYLHGQKFVIMSTVARATVTWISTGASFVGAPVALVANTPVMMHYDHPSLTWYIST